MLNARQLTWEAAARRQSDGGGGYDRGYGAATTYRRAVAAGGTIERPARAGARMSACERRSSGGRRVRGLRAVWRTVRCAAARPAMLPPPRRLLPFEARPVPPPSEWMVVEQIAPLPPTQAPTPASLGPQVTPASLAKRHMGGVAAYPRHAGICDEERVQKHQELGSQRHMQLGTSLRLALREPSLA